MNDEWQSLTHRFAISGHKGYIRFASTSPSSRPCNWPACAMKRCRQRKAVVTATPQRRADSRTDSRSTNERPNASQRCL